MSGVLSSFLSESTFHLHYFKLLLVFIYPFAITIVPFSGVYLEGRFLEGRKLVFLQLPKPICRSGSNS